MCGSDPAGDCFFIDWNAYLPVGFTEPTSGTAEIEGFDIRYDMDRIYSLMGVCPQVKLCGVQGGILISIETVNST